MGRVALSDPIFANTNPLTLLKRKSAYVYLRGTATKATLYTAEEGGSTLAQPLTTGTDGRPKREGKTPWINPGSYDLSVNGETLRWEAVDGDTDNIEPAGASYGNVLVYDGNLFIPRPKPELDARDWVGYAETSSDRGPHLNEALEAASEAGRTLALPPFRLTVSEPGVVESFQELRGHLGASEIKVGAGSNCGAIKSARYDAGGENGGTERTSVRGVDFDGNFAQNSGVTEPVVALDGIRPIVEKVHVKNGYENLASIMSRDKSPGTSKLEDGIFRDIGLLDPQVCNFNVEGPHDSQLETILCRSNDGVNVLSTGTALVWTNLHAYGNAEYGVKGQGVFHGLIAEGAENGQILILADSSKFFNPWLFDGGGADGKIGFVFGDAEHSANSTLIVGAKIDNCINGALQFNRSAANSYISGLISAPSGNIATEVSNASPKLNIDGLRVTGGCVNNLATRSKSSQTEVDPPFSPEIELTGTSEVKVLKPSYAGHILTLRLTSTAKVVDNGTTLNLAGDFTGPGMLTLRCDGSNFREMARAAV
jgi:hypothetical protein